MKIAWVVKLAYTHDSRSCAARRAGSTPAPGTKNKNTAWSVFLFFWWDLNEGWVGGKAAGFPPYRKLFKTEGFENAIRLKSDE